MEKAHGDVFNVLLQILDDGRVTDSQGRVVSFKNAILIMTSNIGSQFVLEGLSGDNDPHAQHARREAVMNAVRALPTEFVNRVDEYIVFDPLDFSQVRKIVAQQVERVRARLADRKIGLHVADDATHLLCEAGYDPAMGARPVKRAVQHLLETALAQAILRGDVAEDETAVVGVDGEGDSRRLFVTKIDGMVPTYAPDQEMAPAATPPTAPVAAQPAAPPQQRINPLRRRTSPDPDFTTRRSTVGDQQQQ